MGIVITNDDIDGRIAERLRSLRQEKGWSLDQLAKQSGVSRATLSRLENGEVSPTASVLGKLCAAHSLTLSRLMFMVEADFVPLVSRQMQDVWTDPATGYRRRLVSPPSGQLSAEVLECELKPGTSIDYERPPTPGLEHHLVMLDGVLEITIEGTLYRLKPGDCLRYQLHGTSVFRTGDKPARYILVTV